MFFRRKTNKIRMVIEVDETNNVDIHFDWPKSKDAEQAKGNVAGLSALLWTLKMNDLWPGYIQALATAGNLKGEAAVSTEAIRVLGAMENKQKGLVQPLEEYEQPIVRPSEVFFGGRYGDGH